jgi:hypothetical protein
VGADFAHQPGKRLRHFARFAAEGVAQHHRPDALRLKEVSGREQGGAAIGDDALFDAGETRRTGLRRLSPAAPAARWRCTLSGALIERRARIASASVKVEASGANGPDAITAGSSPATSEISSAVTGARQAVARCPPRVCERCLRTVLISAMGAPLFSSAALTACSSGSEMPATGRLSRLEPPPEINASTRSSGAALRT